MKIAIVRLSSLGDVISTAVFLKLIKEEFIKKYGMLEITFIVDSSFRQILQDSQYVIYHCERAKKIKRRFWKYFLHCTHLSDLIW